MSRHSVSSLELLLGLFGSALAGLFWLGGYIWRIYSQTFDETTTQGNEANDDRN